MQANPFRYDELGNYVSRSFGGFPIWRGRGGPFIFIFHSFFSNKNLHSKRRKDSTTIFCRDVTKRDPSSKLCQFNRYSTTLSQDCSIAVEANYFFVFIVFLPSNMIHNIDRTTIVQVNRLGRLCEWNFIVHKLGSQNLNSNEVLKGTYRMNVTATAKPSPTVPSANTKPPIEEVAVPSCDAPVSFPPLGVAVELPWRPVEGKTAPVS